MCLNVFFAPFPSELVLGVFRRIFRLVKTFSEPSKKFKNFNHKPSYSRKRKRLLNQKYVYTCFLPLSRRLGFGRSCFGRFGCNLLKHTVSPQTNHEISRVWTSKNSSLTGNNWLQLMKSHDFTCLLRVDTFKSWQTCEITWFYQVKIFLQDNFFREYKF